MARPVIGRDLAVILGSLGGIRHQDGDGRPCGLPLEHSRENLRLVALAPAGSVLGLARPTPVQVFLYVFFI